MRIARTAPAGQVDGESVSKLVAEHYGSVFQFCARRVGPELAADAAQETFVTAQKRLGSFENNSKLTTWLYGIANNHCRNIARKKRFEIKFTDMWQAPSPSESSLIDLAVLKQTLLTLSAEHREAVVLHEIEGLTYEEIAEILKIPPGTVKSRLHHAFENLRKALVPQKEVLV